MRSAIRHWAIAALEIWRTVYLQAEAQCQQQAAASVENASEQYTTLSHRPVKAQISLTPKSKTKTTMTYDGTRTKRV